MTKILSVLCACILLSACSGGGGSSSSTTAASTTTTPAPVALTNFAAITVDDGPAALNTGANGYTSDDAAFVSVTLCAPGSTTNCQTVDHVLVDTGSVGLRVLDSVLNASLLSALPNQTDASSNPVGECYGFVDGYMFGSVRQTDFTVGGEAVSNMPIQVVGDTGAFATVPKSCSSQGGPNLNTLNALGANGILGIGVTTTDCGALCTAGGTGASIYYDCPSTGCGAATARAAAVTAPFQQLPNPVAAMSVDNNGTIISLPSVASGGQATATGTLYFGIGTQTNNGLGSATVLTTTTSSSANGAGLLTAIYNNQTLNESYIDSGSNLYVFVDKTITACASKDFTGFYCPASPLALSPTIKGANGATASGAFTLNNAQTLLANTTNAAVPGVGGNPNLFSGENSYPNSFDFGLPFFFGRNVYTALEGRAAAGATGPYIAF